MASLCIRYSHVMIYCSSLLLHNFGYIDLFNTYQCYAPISVSFGVNFACLISNFVSVIVLSLGFNFHKTSLLTMYFNVDQCYAPISVSFVCKFACLIRNFVSAIVLSLGFNFHKFSLNSRLVKPRFKICTFSTFSKLSFESGFKYPFER